MRKEKKTIHTKAARIAELGRRAPFRPFALRVDSGATYVFAYPQSFGATGDLRLIVHFDVHRCTSIDTDSITEVIEQTPPK